MFHGYVYELKNEKWHIIYMSFCATSFRQKNQCTASMGAALGAVCDLSASWAGSHAGRRFTCYYFDNTTQKEQLLIQNSPTDNEPS